MKISLTDRLVSALAYCTFGFFSIIWIIYANITNKRISPFLQFNLYQAIFLSVVLFIFSILYEIAVGFVGLLPFVGKYITSLNIFINATPIFFGFTITSLLVFVLCIFLSVASIFGIRPRIPLISNIVTANFGG